MASVYNHLPLPLTNAQLPYHERDDTRCVREPDTITERLLAFLSRLPRGAVFHAESVRYMPDGRHVARVKLSQTLNVVAALGIITRVSLDEYRWNGDYNVIASIQARRRWRVTSGASYKPSRRTAGPVRAGSPPAAREWSTPAIVLPQPPQLQRSGGHSAPAQSAAPGGHPTTGALRPAQRLPTLEAHMDPQTPQGSPVLTAESDEWGQLSAAISIATRPASPLPQQHTLPPVRSCSNCGERQVAVMPPGGKAMCLPCSYGQSPFQLV